MAQFSPSVRFSKFADKLTANQRAVGKNYDYLADNAGIHVALAYLARVKGSAIDNTGMALLLGNTHLINAYGVGGSANFPVFTIDPDGVTLRVGKARPNWQRKLATDPRPSYVLPAVVK